MKINRIMLKLKTYFIILLPFSVIYLIKATKHEEEKRILDKILDNRTYDKNIRPIGINITDDDEQPCIVTINVIIKTISNIDENKMVFSVQMVVRQYWADNRLVYTSMLNTNESKTKLAIRFILLTDMSKLWTPHLYIPAFFNQITVSDNRVQISPEGNVIHSNLVSLTRSCPMNLKYFPFDKQICEIVITSYSYTTDDIRFKWFKNGSVKMARKFTLPRFNLSRFEITEFNFTTQSGTQISGLKLTLHFKREYGYYIIQFYVPCALLVIISWLSFWLNEIPTDARLSLVVTNLITLTLLIVAINSTLPTSSYIKILDVYTGVCLLFVIATVFQYTMATLAAFEEERIRKKLDKVGGLPPLPAIKSESKKTISEVCNWVSIGKADKDVKSSNVKVRVVWSKLRKWRQRFLPQDMPRSKRIDNASKFLFPLLFFFFLLVYWIFLPKD